MEVIFKDSKQVPQVNQDLPTEIRVEKDNTKEESIKDKDTIIIKEVGYRWVIVVTFFMLSFSNGMQWVTFSSIADNFKKVFNVSSDVVNLFSLSYMYCYPLVFPFAAYIIDNKTTRGGVRKYEQ